MSIAFNLCAQLGTWFRSRPSFELKDGSTPPKLIQLIDTILAPNPSNIAGGANALEVHADLLKDLQENPGMVNLMEFPFESQTLQYRRTVGQAIPACNSQDLCRGV